MRLTLACGLLLLAGCSNLGARASLSLACPESEILIDGWTASGCGRTDAFYSDDGEWVSLRDRAAFDLDCNRAELDVARLSAQTFGVTGCGKRAAYRTSDVVGFALDFNSKTESTRASGSASSSAGPATRP